MRSLLVILVLVLAGISCSSGDPLLDDVYTRNAYPGEDATYSLGSSELSYEYLYISDGIYISGEKLDPIAKSLVDTRGDIIVGIADDVPTRLASSESNDQVLTVDTTTATGLKWAAPVGDSEVVVVLSSDVANSTVNLADVVGLSFTAAANSTYVVEVFLLWDSSATEVGIGISAAATGSPVVQAGLFQAGLGSSSWNANDVLGLTSASPFTSSNVGKVTAVLKTADSTSTWQLRFAAEEAGTVTVRTGSTLRYRKVA